MSARLLPKPPAVVPIKIFSQKIYIAIYIGAVNLPTLSLSTFTTCYHRLFINLQSLQFDNVNADLTEQESYCSIRGIILYIGWSKN